MCGRYLSYLAGVMSKVSRKRTTVRSGDQAAVAAGHNLSAEISLQEIVQSVRDYIAQAGVAGRKRMPLDRAVGKRLAEAQKLTKATEYKA